MFFEQNIFNRNIKKTLLEAQELAVKEHNIEYKSNLWICNNNLLISTLAFRFN
jgi:hypothetical protein